MKSHRTTMIRIHLGGSSTEVACDTRALSLIPVIPSSDTMVYRSRNHCMNSTSPHIARSCEITAIAFMSVMAITTICNREVCRVICQAQN